MNTQEQDEIERMMVLSGMSPGEASGHQHNGGVPLSRTASDALFQGLRKKYGYGDVMSALNEERYLKARRFLSER